MTVRAMIATMASLLAIVNDLVAKFEGVRVDGRKGEHCGSHGEAVWTVKSPPAEFKDECPLEFMKL